MALGSIVVRLTMNTADFETDAGRAAKVAERRAKQIDDAFKKAGTAIGLALGAALIGATAAIKRTIDSMDEMSKAAQKVQMPTEDFSRLAYAGELADVSMETLVGSLGKLTKAQSAALKETSEQARVFEALGIAIKDVEGNLRPASQVLADFADRFVELRGSPEAMAAGFSLFGRSFQEMIPLLKDGSAGLREAGMEADALGKTISTEAGIAAEEFNDNLTRLQSGIQGVWQEIGAELLPKLVDLTEQMLAWVQEGSNAKEIADGVASAFSAVASAASTLAAGFDIVKNRIAGTQEMLIGVRDGVSALFSLDLSKIADAAGRFDAGLQQAANGRRANFSNVQGTPDFSNVVGTPRSTGSGLDAGRLRSALGGGGGRKPGGGGKSRAAELSEEQKAAQRLEEQYKQLIATADERIALVGVESEVTKLAYELQNGELSKLTQLQKDELMVRALKLEAMESARKQIDEETEAMKRQAEVVATLLEDLRFESEILGKTREEQEILNNLRYAGVEANSAYGQSIIDATKNLQDQRRAVEESVEVQDMMRANFEGLFTDLISGTKSAKDAFKDFAASVLADIARIIAKRMVEQLFGETGSTETGSSGINWGQLFGSFFGGQRAMGGPVRAGKLYEVGEGNRPEMLSMSGRTYLIPGNEGRITPNVRTGGGNIQQTFVTAGVETRQTTERRAQLAGREAQRALARTGR